MARETIEDAVATVQELPERVAHLVLRVIKSGLEKDMNEDIPKCVLSNENMMVDSSCKASGINEQQGELRANATAKFVGLAI